MKNKVFTNTLYRQVDRESASEYDRLTAREKSIKFINESNIEVLHITEVFINFLEVSIYYKEK